MLKLSTLAIALAAIAVAVAGAVVAPASAEAARGLDVGFADDQYGDDLLTNPDAAVRDEWFDKLEGTNANLARINVYWSQSVTNRGEPDDPTNPGDPDYNWARTDAAVRDAAERGITPVLTVFNAPSWAEAPGRPADVRPGSYRPNATQFGRFAQAIARRYSGNYTDPGGGGRLPQVKFYEAWNEPNLPNYITPQWKGKRPKSPDIYRDLLNEFYRGIHSVNDSNVVIAGGTSPFGDKRGGTRMRPYYFWRQVFCLKGNLKKDRKCARRNEPALMDRYAHNPINATRGAGPTTKPFNSDDGTPANFKDLTKIVRKAEKARTVKPRGRRGGWATETWYESKPGEKKAVSPRKQAKFQAQVLYVLWKQRAEAVIFLQLRDSPYDPTNFPLVGLQTGVYTIDEKAKPSLKAVQFPFVADRKSKKKVLLWGKAPESGKIVVKKGRRKVARFRAREGQVFTKKIRLKGKAKLKARQGGEKSLTWKVGKR